MKIQRVERHNINKGSPLWDICDELCFKSKNIYNYANYIMRQSFINKNGIIKYNDLTKQLKHSEPFKDLGSNSSQHTLKMLCRNWKSFMELLKMYNKNPKSLLAKPKLPKYKNKNGRYICILTNWQSQIKNGYLYFAFKPLKPFNNLIKTKIQGKHMQTRIIPNGNNYILELVYEKDIKEINKESNRIIGIDLGVNNFATIVNNIGEKPIIINGKGIKSYNKFYNKKKAKIQSNIKTKNNLDWCNKLNNITNKRYWKIEYFLHKSSKYIVDYCKLNSIDTVIIGLNKTWKQNCKLKNKENQTFIQIPYNKFIEKLKYKCENNGINFIITEESYTSGTSFLDDELPIKENYNKNRRIHRGLFKSNNGKLINADVNGAFQIIKKVFSNSFKGYEIEGLDFTPSIINLL